MDTGNRAGQVWSELDATRVARALAIALLIRFAVLPVLKWITLLVLLPTLLLLIL